MGSYDDNSGNSPIPGGSLAKPVMIALGALLIGKLLKGNSDDAPATQAQPVPEQPQAGGGLLGGGLGGLLDQLKQSGLGDKVDSWVGQGENHPIEPGQLGNAIGQTTLEQIAAHAGIDQQELLNQLSQVLPGLVDKLTANGQVPDANTLSKLLQGR
ncbi:MULTISPECIES: YidB family protein [unclassified Brucella]|uniref:YidB family protein n=1 Tax=unclassified Brucella TaxID=2632610 RepID=UPI000D03A1BA|nr:MULTISPECIES: YidB family protein [unclassified Brucella]